MSTLDNLARAFGMKKVHHCGWCNREMDHAGYCSTYCSDTDYALWLFLQELKS